MKLVLIFLLLLQPVFAFPQTDEIVRILNKELENEVRAQKEDAINYRGEKFEILKNFSIKDSIQKTGLANLKQKEGGLTQAKIKVLSIETRKKTYYGDEYYTQKQEVDLRKIKAVTKDINIIFEIEGDDVKTTEVNEKGERTIKKGNLFFLQLSHEKQNEHLAEELLKAFEKAAYKIKKGSWYD